MSFFFLLVLDLGVGFRVTGGVRCFSCKTLHTVVTAVSADLAMPELREGELVTPVTIRVQSGGAKWFLSCQGGGVLSSLGSRGL